MPGVEIRLWARREAPLAFARERRLADICSQELKEAVSGAELVVLCTPTGTFANLAEKFGQWLGKETIVTDVGSTKGNVHAGAGSYLKKTGHIFVGSHPMAGSEKQGIEHAQADLFQKAVVAITNENRADEGSVARVSDFWHLLGASVFQTSAACHDGIVALISHIPHLYAALAARAAMLGKMDANDLRAMASTGFRDTTRVCSGSPELWTDILTQNAEAICPFLEQSIADQQRLQQLLKEGRREELQQWLSEAKQSRESIC